MTVRARVLAGLALVAIVLAQFGGVDSALAVGPCAVGPGCGGHAAPGPIIGAGLPRSWQSALGPIGSSRGSVASKTDIFEAFLHLRPPPIRSWVIDHLQSEFIPGQSLSVASGRRGHADDQR
jgi:hypothetical protein